MAGVQITASHNPPADNGYKVYLADGAQLAPPSDAEIEAAIAAAPPARVRADRVAAATTSDVTEAYLDRVGAAPPRHGARDLRVALTPLHGVGGETAVHALRPAGFTDVHVVQAAGRAGPRLPDGRVPQPRGARRHRPAAGAGRATSAPTSRSRSTRTPTAARWPSPAAWRMLTGDETGVLLGDHLLRSGGYTDPLVATTIVSSSMLRAVAAAHGARYAETLTGFKWIVRGGPGLVFGYEEALGYCVDPDAVRDKDGIAAAVVACDLAATLKAAGSGLPDRLDALAREHGVHATAGVSLRMEPAARDAVVERLRAAPPAGWTTERPAPDVLVLRRRAVGGRPGTGRRPSSGIGRRSSQARYRMEALVGAEPPTTGTWPGAPRDPRRPTPRWRSAARSR